MRKQASEATTLLWQHLGELPLAPWREKEYRFDPKRRWRFDFAVWTERYKIGIEIEGGAWTMGRHTRGLGFIADMEKYNQATLLGWRMLRFTPKQVLNGDAIAFIKQVLTALR